MTERTLKDEIVAFWDNMDAVDADEAARDAAAQGISFSVDGRRIDPCDVFLQPHHDVEPFNDGGVWAQPLS